MPEYSIRYLQAINRLSTITLLPFDINKVATDFARIGLVSNRMVEVWAKDTLVIRIVRDGCPECDSEAQRTQAAADTRAERQQALEEWDNEGGSGRRLT